MLQDLLLIRYKLTVHILRLFNLFFTSTGINVAGGMQSEMPLSIGIMLTMGIILFLVCRIEFGRLHSHYEKLGFITLFFGLIALWMSSVYFPWNNLQVFGEHFAYYACAVQIPWRYLSIATVMLVFTTTCAIKLIALAKNVKIAKICAIAIVCLGTIVIGIFYSNYTNTAEERHIYSQNEIGTMEIGNGEYLPLGTNLNDLTMRDVITSGVKVDNYEYKKGVSIITCTNLDEYSGTVQLPLLYYKNYQSFDLESGMQLQIEKGINNTVRLIIPGNYTGTVQVKFVSPWYWRVSEFVSFCTMILIIVQLIAAKKPIPFQFLSYDNNTGC